MDNRILILRLEGPMQSWGIRSRWDIRDTCLEPTKSGVLGLLGCAMGIPRNDPELEVLDRTLLFGVRVENPGSISTDYHTVTGYHRIAQGGFKHASGKASGVKKAMEHGPATVVSIRDYIHDADFLIALAMNPEIPDGNPALFDSIVLALQNPVWPVFLGRKSCVPTRPVFERITDEYPDLETAILTEPWSGKKKTNEPFPVLEAWIECKQGEYIRQDAIRNNQLRFYEYRHCRRVEVDAGALRSRES